MTHSLQDLEAMADDFADEPVDYWKPKVGDKLAGELVNIRRQVTEKDPDCPVVTFKLADGTLLDWFLFHTVARNEMAELEPKIGDKLVVKRLESHPDKGYYRYKIFSNKAKAKSFDWGDMDIDAGDVDPKDKGELLGTKASEGTFARELDDDDDDDDFGI